MLIVIAGAGSIGSYLGIALKKKYPDYRIVLVRKRGHDGILLMRSTGIVNDEAELELLVNKELLEIPDIVFITSQKQQTLDLIKNIKVKLNVNNNTTFVVLQNGLDPCKIVHKYYYNNPIIHGVVWWSATLITENLVLYHRAAPTILGIPSYINKSEKNLTEVVNLLSPILTVSKTDNIEIEMYKKLILNVVSPVLALIKKPYPEGLNNITARKIIHILFDEAVGIAKKLNWSIKDEKLINFHNLLKTNDMVKVNKKTEYTHKVSTQISAEKYGGKNSNAKELLLPFLAQGGVACATILDEIRQLPPNYEAVSENKLMEILSELEKLKVKCLKI